MRILLISALLLLSTAFAYADDDSPAAAASSGSTYSSATYDFTVWLPDGGTIADAQTDPKWDYDENTVFTWVDENLDQPVFLVMGSALSLDTDATDDDISNFVAGLTDEDNNKANNTEVQKVSDVFQVGSRGWVSVLFKDVSTETPGEFEIFVTRQGVHIYAIAFHYTDGSEAGGDFAQQVLTSFATSQG
jgi:hypothetical protein